MTASPAPPGRLIDLAVEWPLQYAGESTAIAAEAVPGLRDRLGQVEGYLSTTRAALVWIGPAPGGRPDPWAEVALRMSGVEAEFSGRILAGPADLDRFAAEPPDAMTWAVVGLRDAASLLGSADAAERLAALVDRGVRAIRLAGIVDRPPDPGDGRGLSDAERAAIARVVGLAAGRPLLLDLAGLPPTAAGEAIARLDEAARSGAGPGRVVPIVGLGGAPASGTIAGLRPDDLARLRALGGVVGLCPGRAFHADADAFARSIAACLARAGRAGVAIGSGFLGIAEPAEGLDDAPALLGRLASGLAPDEAGPVASGNALALFASLARGRAADDSGIELRF